LLASRGNAGQEHLGGGGGVWGGGGGGGGGGGVGGGVAVIGESSGGGARGPRGLFDVNQRMHLPQGEHFGG